MSHDTTKSTGINKTPSQESEDNILLPIMYGEITSLSIPTSHVVTQGKRAPRVGLRGARGRKYSWAEKLEARIISKGDGCWEVSGYQLPNGYVQISCGSIGSPEHAVKAAHRLAYELAHGPIPDGQVIAHTCDNPRCVRVDHLVATTQKENIYDSVRKGRYNVFGVQKLNAEQVLAIREMAAAGEHQRVIAKRFGIARNTVSGIVNHKSWAHLTKLVSGPQPPASVSDIALRNVSQPVKTVQVPVRGDLHVGSVA